MAHEIDLTTGRAAMAFTGETPWHGLGHRLAPNATIDEWKKTAGMNWRAERHPVLYTAANATQVYAGQSVLVRDDTHAPLAIISDRYQEVQPGEVLEFFRGLVEGVGDFHMETAGCLKGGKRLWAMARCEKSFRVGDEDKMRRYLLLSTSFDKTLATTVMQTSVRVVCNNTLNLALFGSADMLMQTHLKKFEPEIVKRRMNLDPAWLAFKAACAKLVGLKVSRKKAVEIYTTLFADEALTDKGTKKLLDNVMKILDNAPGQQIDTAKGTAWGVLNSVTYYVDHAQRARTNENRLISSFWGKGSNLKQRAMEMVLAI